MSKTHFRSGMLVFPGLTQRELAVPYKVLARLPAAPERGARAAVFIMPR